jgi:hypothetical protein
MGDKVDNHTKTGGEQRESKNKAGSGATLDTAPQVQTVFQELKVRRKHRVCDANAQCSLCGRGGGGACSAVQAQGVE